MTIAYASSVLTLTGGTTGARLTPANVINDATAFSTGSTYAVDTIMKYNAGGLGMALYRCTTAVTVAGAFNAANWTLVAYIQGSNSLWLGTSLVVSAYYNDDNWSYYCASGLVYAGTGCDWVSGSTLNSKNNIGFTVTYTGSGFAQGQQNILVGSNGTVAWTNVRFACPAGANKGASFQSSVMTGSITNCYFTYAENQLFDTPLIAWANLATIRTNLMLNPTGISGLTHSGLYEGNFLDNKIGVATATASGAVISNVKYIVAALGTATLSNWQAFFSSLTAIPSVGDVLTATASGTLAGSATCKQYRALKKYTPDIPADNSRGVGIFGADSLQFFEDMIVPDGFNFATQVKAYYGGASLYFTRLINITAKQGAALLAGVKVRAVNTSNNSELSVETTNASGVISKQMLIYSGERVGGGSYVVLQNAKDYRVKSFLFRRKDLVEATYPADMTINGVELTQFMSTDAYYTTDQTANLADVSFTTSGGAINGMTINAAMTLDRLWDITKAYFDANMGIANPFTASGKTFNLSTIPVSGAQLLSAGTKLTGAQSSGAITAVGTLQAGVAITGSLTTTSSISLAGVNTGFFYAGTQIIGLPTTGAISTAGALGFGTGSTITATGDLSISSTTLTGTLTIDTATARTLTLTNCTGALTVNVTGGGTVTVVLAGTTAAGSVTTGAGVTKAVQCTVAVNGGATFNLVKRYGTTGAFTDLGYTSGITADAFLVPLGQPVEVAIWTLGYLTFTRTIQTTDGGFDLVVDMIPEPDVDTTLDVSSYLANISVTYLAGTFTATFNADMDVPGLESGKAVLHRLLGLEGSMRALLPPGMSTTVDIEPDEIQFNKPQVILALGAGATNVSIACYMNTAPAKLIDPTYIINPRRAGDNLRVEIPLVKPALDVAAMAAAVRAELATELARIDVATSTRSTLTVEQIPAGLTVGQSEQLRKVAALHGVGAALVVTPTTRVAGDVSQAITTVDTTTTVAEV